MSIENEFNNKESEDDLLEFGIRIKWPPKDLGLYFLAQRGSMLYGKLREMPSAKTQEQRINQRIFTDMKVEIQRRLEFSAHLPVISEEGEGVFEKIFNYERENRLYYYLCKANSEERERFDQQLDELANAFWDFYEDICLGKNLEKKLQLLDKLEVVILLRRIETAKNREEALQVVPDKKNEYEEKRNQYIEGFLRSQFKKRYAQKQRRIGMAKKKRNKKKKR